MPVLKSWTSQERNGVVSDGVANLRNGDMYLGINSPIFKRLGYEQPGLIAFDCDFTLVEYPRNFLLQQLATSLSEILTEQHGEVVHINVPKYTARKGLIWNIETFQFFDLKSINMERQNNIWLATVTLISDSENEEVIQFPWREGTLVEFWHHLISSIRKPYVFLACEFTYCLYLLYKANYDKVTSDIFAFEIIPKMFAVNGSFYKYVRYHIEQIPKASYALRSAIENLTKAGYRLAVISNSPTQYVQTLLDHVYGHQFTRMHFPVVIGRVTERSKEEIITNAWKWHDQFRELVALNGRMIYIGDSIKTDVVKEASLVLLLADEWKTSRFADFTGFCFEHKENNNRTTESIAPRLDLAPSFADLVHTMSTILTCGAQILYYQSDSSGVIGLKPGTLTAAGLDLPIPEDTILKAGEKFKIELNIRFEAHRQMALLLLNRSSNFKRNIHIVNGLIDSDYRGKLSIMGTYTGKEDLVLLAGERIAQLVQLPYLGNTAFDIRATYDISLVPGESHILSAKMFVPESVRQAHCFLLIMPISQQSETFTILSRTVEYKGDFAEFDRVTVYIKNTTNKVLTIHHKEKIALGVAIRNYDTILENLTELDNSARGEQGLGSSGL